MPFLVLFRSESMEPISLFRELQKKVEQERVRTTQVKCSDEWYAFDKQIQALQASQQLLLDGIPDSTAELMEAKKVVMEQMKQQGVFNIENVYAKIKEKNEVNKTKVLNVLGGDIGILMELATFTQVALKDFGKANPAMKHALLNCIETVSQEITDVEIQVDS